MLLRFTMHGSMLRRCSPVQRKTSPGPSPDRTGPQILHAERVELPAEMGLSTNFSSEPYAQEVFVREYTAL